MILIKHTANLVPTREPRSGSWHKITCTKSSHGLNFGRAENHDHLTDSCPSTIESWPTAGHNQTSPQSLKSNKVEKPMLTHIKQLWHNLSQNSEGVHTQESCQQSQEQDTRRSTSSNPQENYQNTTALSLFCKKANDHVTSPQTFQAINKWPVWTFFKILLEEYVEPIPHILPQWIMIVFPSTLLY
jgi:hypothetical protein